MPLWKLWIKAIFQILLSAAAGVCGSIVATGFTSKLYDDVFWGALILGISILIIDIILNIRYSKKELEYNKYKEIINLFSNFTDEYKGLSKRIYSIIKKAQLSKTIEINAHYRVQSYDFLCENLFKTICLISEKGDNLSVSIILKENGKYIMVSHYGKSRTPPSLYDEPLSEDDASKYYYAQILKKKKPDPQYLMSIKEINENFYLDKDCHDKYEQYIGVPINCTGRNISGLLQIVVYKGTKITTKLTRMKQLVNDIVYPYVYYALLCEKIEKIFMIGGVHNGKIENQKNKTNKSNKSK